MLPIQRIPAKATLEARLAQSRGLARADLSIAAAATKAGRRKALKPVAKLSNAADKRPLLAVSAAIAGLGLIRGDRKMQKAGMRMFLAVGLATTATRLGKHAISRTRPTQLVDQHRHAIFPGGPFEHDLNSFPSAHAAGGFAAARALGRDYPLFAPQALSAALAAGALKVLKGDHFPSDVIAGLAVGAAAEAVAEAILPVEKNKDETKRHPHHPRRR
jgi:membrane-associated phospholipid phosphatase